MFSSLGRATYEQDAWRIRPFMPHGGAGGGGDTYVSPYYGGGDLASPDETTVGIFRAGTTGSYTFTPIMWIYTGDEFSLTAVNKIYVNDGYDADNNVRYTAGTAGTINYTFDPTGMTEVYIGAMTAIQGTLSVTAGDFVHMYLIMGTGATVGVSGWIVNYIE